MADLETFAHDTARGMPSPTSRAGKLSWEDVLARARVARDYSTLQALCRRAEKLEREEGFPPGHAPLRVALLAGGAPQMLAGPLKLALIASGFGPSLHVAPYDSIVPELLSAESGASQFAPDVAILVNTIKEIPLWPRLGEGPERAAIEARIRRHGLDDSVALPGFVDNPYACMARAGVVALSSRWEGLPTVLIESLAVGTPVVSTDCPSGPREILRDGALGTLVPTGDVSALASAIARTLANGRISPPVEALRRFTPEVVLDQYQRVFEQSA